MPKLRDILSTVREEEMGTAEDSHEKVGQRS